MTNTTKHNTPFFSVIIPVYNGISHNLPQCLNSIWHQPIDTNLYEVICIDDCSTDDTRNWLIKQSKTHPNLKVLYNKVNIRQGGGRNRGIKEACGKYIVFIDQDDYFHKDSLRILVDELKSEIDLDVFVSDSAYQFHNHESNKLQLNFSFKERTTPTEFCKHNGIVFAPWRMCLRRIFLLKNKIFFTEHCRIEDFDWACKVFYYAQSIKYRPFILVHYNKGESGQTDNMYRNMDTLMANTIAGNRTLNLANDLFAAHPLCTLVRNVADTYYNYSCRYLFGSFKALKTKVKIIKTIQVNKSNYRLVNFAINNPYIFSIILNSAAL